MLKLIPTLLSLLAFFNSPRAQPGRPPLPRGRSLDKDIVREYADSVEFKRQFNEIYRILHPTDTLRSMVLQGLETNWKRKKDAPIDSVVFFEGALGRIEQDYERRLYFNTYRKLFTADELKQLKALLANPIGKKFLAALPELGLLEARIGSYAKKIVADASRELRPVRPAGIPPAADSARVRIRTNTSNDSLLKQ